MIKQITYQPKVQVRPAGPDINTWRDRDANEVKDVVNSNAEVIASHRVTGAVTFKKLGTWVGSPSSPETGATILLDPTDAINGAVACVYYSGAVLTKDSFSGGTVVFFNGGNVQDELCAVWIAFDQSSYSFHVNVVRGYTGDIPTTPGAPAAPTNLTLTVGDIAVPAAPTNLSLTVGDF